MEKRGSGKERDLDTSQLTSLKSILSLLDEDELVCDRIPKPKSNKGEGSRSATSEHKSDICGSCGGRSPGCKCQYPELKVAVLQPRESLRNRRGPYMILVCFWIWFCNVALVWFSNIIENLEESNSSSQGIILPSVNQATAAADALPLPSARTPIDLPASSLQAPQTSISGISNRPTPNTTLSPSRWTPQDDGIEVPFSSQEMDAHSRNVLYGRGSGRRLPAFVELGKVSDSTRDDPDEEATNTG